MTSKILSLLLKFLTILEHLHSMAPDPFPVAFLGDFPCFLAHFKKKKNPTISVMLHCLLRTIGRFISPLLFLF